MAGKFITKGNVTTGSGVGRSGAAWKSRKVGKGPTNWRIDGIENMMSNINGVLQTMKVKGTGGLIRAAKFVLNDADMGTSPLVPHDTGTLRNSTFTNPHKVGPSGDPYITFGYATNYAAAVHEMLSSPTGNPINWNRPGSGPKFLEASLKRNAEIIVAIIAKHTEI